MEKVKCIKCGRPLHDPESVARRMGPECAGNNDGYRRKNLPRAHTRGSSSYVAMDVGNPATPTLFGLITKVEQYTAPTAVENAPQRKGGLTEIQVKFPTDLIDLVLSAPAPGAIAGHAKNYSKKRKREGSMHPSNALQEIRRMCIDLRLTFFPGMLTPQGQQIACLPYGDDGWRFDNSERVMSRQELVSYLARYGTIHRQVGEAMERGRNPRTG